MKKETIKPYIDYSRIGHEEFMNMVKTSFSEKEMILIDCAYRISKYGHGHTGQKRECGRRYFDHPKQVAIICYEEFEIRSREVIIAALLHDIAEDTFILPFSGIELFFGKRVAKMVRLLSKQPKEGYLERLIAFGNADVWMVKLADNLHNLRTLTACKPEKRKRKIAETRSDYFPLIELIRDRIPHHGPSIARHIKSLFDDVIYHYEFHLSGEK